MSSGFALTGGRESVPPSSDENHSSGLTVLGIRRVIPSNEAARRQLSDSANRRKAPLLSGERARGVQPRNKEVGGEHFVKRKKAERGCKDYADEVKALQEQECKCVVKCSGAWSDTPHGLHGMQCKIAYKRLLSLRENFLTGEHHPRPNSASFPRKAWGVVEFMCGVAMLSAVWAAFGAVVCGLCELKD